MRSSQVNCTSTGQRKGALAPARSQLQEIKKQCPSKILRPCRGTLSCLGPKYKVQLRVLVGTGTLYEEQQEPNPFQKEHLGGAASNGLPDPASCNRQRRFDCRSIIVLLPQFRSQIRNRAQRTASVLVRTLSFYSLIYRFTGVGRLALTCGPITSPNQGMSATTCNQVLNEKACLISADLLYLWDVLVLNYLRENPTKSPSWESIKHLHKGHVLKDAALNPPEEVTPPQKLVNQEALGP